VTAVPAPRALRVPALLLALVIGITACTGVAASTATDTRSEGTVTGAGRGSLPLPSGDVPPATASYIARARGPLLEVFDAPGGGIPVESGPLDNPTNNGTALVLAVVGQPDPAAEWLKVLLPVRPNFSTGWVRAADVEVTWTDYTIDIDLSEHRLELRRGGELVTWGTVAIGRPGARTPTGRTAVNELLASPEPEGLYGPFALGLSLWSDTVTEYAGGNGQIGIHGTNRPELLGSDVSLGCVRVGNDLVTDLAGRVPLGTPVVIHD